MDAASTRNESNRLKVLHGFSILDTPVEPAFDGIMELATTICGTPIAWIGFVDQHRQWLKATVGLDAITSFPRDSFCDYLGLGPQELMQVPDTLLDARYASHFLVLHAPTVRFFAAAPLCVAGVVVGALCVADRVPRLLEPHMHTSLQNLARQVVCLLELRRALVQLKFWSDTQYRQPRPGAGSPHSPEDLNLVLSAQSASEPVLGLKSQRAFDFILNEESARAERTKSPLALVFVDIDYFKSFSDEFGRLAAEAVLEQVARMLQSQARPYDHAASYGAEGFAIALPETRLDASLVVAERVRKAVQDHEWQHRSITVSVGVATTASAQGSMNLVERASRALDEAKRRGRNCVVYVGED